MMNDKTIKKLPHKEMIRCEVSGKLVPIEECEVIVVKIVKHVDADLNGFNPFGATSSRNETKVFSTEASRVQAPSPMAQAEANQEKPVYVDKPKSIIPPGIAAMMYDTGHPDFEQKGAKEKRRV